jgi:branched-chain amino acid transport system ATP-binding protein
MLEVKHITKGFNGYKVIENLSLTLEQGKIYALIGSNGVGKTTLLNLLDGQLKPISGDIRLNKKRINKWSVWKRAQNGILRTWQHGREFKNLTVLENLLVSIESNFFHLFVAFLKNFLARKNTFTFDSLKQFIQLFDFDKYNKIKAIGILALYDLDSKQLQLASELSLGQKRLLDFARLQMNANIDNGNNLILLDEPFSGIDSNKIDIIKKTIEGFAGKGNAVLMVEHNTALAFPICHRVLLINNGKIEIDTTPEKILNDEIAKEIYFGLN